MNQNFMSIFHFGQISMFKKGVIPRKKYWIKISYGYAHFHGSSFTTKKFQEILLSGFRGVALTNFWVVSFILVKFKLKKGVILRKKRIKISCGYAYLHFMSFMTTDFRKILFSSFWRSCADKMFHIVSFILIKFLISKRAFFREKKLNQNYLWICTSSH